MSPLAPDNRHSPQRPACRLCARNGSDGLSFCIFCAPVTPLAGTTGAQDGWQCSHDRRPRYWPPRARSRRYSECAPAATKVVAALDLCSPDGRAHGQADLFSSDRPFTLRVSAATRTWSSCQIARPAAPDARHSRPKSHSCWAGKWYWENEPACHRRPTTAEAGANSSSPQLAPPIACKPTSMRCGR
jgi:hypothetical protein